MRVLLASNHFFGWTGSELNLQAICSIAHSHGHDVFAFFPFLPDSVFASRVVGCDCSSSLAAVLKFAPDVAYTQHYPVAMMLRAAFPDLPIVHALLGVLPHIEHLPPVDLGFSCVLPISEEVQSFNGLGAIGGPRFRISRNIVDDTLFQGTPDLPGFPRAIAMYSYKLESRHVQAITSYVALKGIALTDFRPATPGGDDYALMPDRIRSADIVVASGRGAIEAMLCGRIPLVLANCGDDGLVTPANFESLMRSNFSGRANGRALDQVGIAREVDRYDPNDAPVLQELSRRYFGLSSRKQEVLDVLSEASAGPIPGMPASSIDAIRFFTEGFEQQRQFALRTAEKTRRLSAMLLSEEGLTARELISKGNEEWSTGSIDVALSLFLRAFQEFPDSAHAGRSLVSNLLVQLASREKRATNTAGHVAALEAFQRINPKNLWVATEIARLRLETDVGLG
jgi:hypothetical protein